MKKTALIAFLVGLHIPKAEAEKIAKENPDDGEELAATEVTKLSDAVKAHHKDLLENDPEFTKEIVGKEQGRIYDIVESKLIKKIGLDAKELEGITEKGGKKFEQILEKGIDKLRKKGDATNQELQEENIKLQNENKKLKEEDIPAVEKRVEETRETILTDSALERALSGELPKKLLVGLTAAKATVTSKLGSEYKLGRDTGGKLVILTKEGLKPKSKDGSKTIGAIEFITEILDEEKLLENSGAGGGGGAGTGKGKEFEKTVLDADKQKAQDELDKRYPHLKKAREQAELNKAAIEKNKVKGGAEE